MEILDNLDFYWGNPRSVTGWSARSAVFVVLLNWRVFYLTKLWAQKISKTKLSAVVKWRSPVFTLARVGKLVMILICLDTWKRWTTKCFRFTNSWRFPPHSKGVAITYVLCLCCHAQEHKGTCSPPSVCAQLISVMTEATGAWSERMKHKDHPGHKEKECAQSCFESWIAS